MARMRLNLERTTCFDCCGEINWAQGLESLAACLESMEIFD
jgi:hypothetical protein